MKKTVARKTSTTQKKSKKLYIDKYRNLEIENFLKIYKKNLKESNKNINIKKVENIIIHDYFSLEGNFMMSFK